MADIPASHKRPVIQWEVTTVAGVSEEEAKRFAETLGGTKRNHYSI